MKNKELIAQIKVLPEKPGVYQYYNKKGEIIYIGKAKNLKKRVTSYFNKKQESNKTYVLVKNIASLTYIVVNSEADALLLENNLIKEHQPRYNVLLKDDKTYPSIRITNEAFPRIFKTRNIVKDGSKYYGPYTSVHALDTLLDIILEILPIRTCRLDLSKERINRGNYKLCLQYYIKRCNGGCVKLETEEDYQKHIDGAEKIIKGDANDISRMLLEEMKILADEYKFEEANIIKAKHEQLEKFKSKSIIANTILDETDVFGCDEDENNFYVNMLKVSKGAIILGHNIEYRKRISETKEDILPMAILDLRKKFGSKSKEIIIPFDLEYPIDGVKITIPKIGDKKKILDLSIQNVKHFKIDKLKRSEKLNQEQKSISLLKEFQNKLKLEKIPMTIDCFDISNIAGTNNVAACVVFKKAKPSKKDYRKYTIKTVEGQDDYASMREVVYRRYSRMIKEKNTLPNLILIDGGIGHMESVRQVLDSQLNINVPIAGLVKNEKHRTQALIFGFPPKEVGFNINDPVFRFIAKIQEEVHRFAISFHRAKRSKSQTASELDNIKGIGEKSKFALVNHFKSIKRIQMANLKELEKVIGTHRASIIYKHFHPNLKG